MEKILGGVVNNYVDGCPLIDHDPSTSVFHVVEIPDYRSLTASKLSQALPPRQMMEVLSKGKVIIVKHAPNMDFESFEAAIDEITTRDQVLQLQGTFASLL